MRLDKLCVRAHAYSPGSTFAQSQQLEGPTNEHQLKKGGALAPVAPPCSYAPTDVYTSAFVRPNSKAYHRVNREDASTSGTSQRSSYYMLHVDLA